MADAPPVDSASVSRSGGVPELTRERSAVNLSHLDLINRPPLDRSLPVDPAVKVSCRRVVAEKSFSRLHPAGAFPYYHHLSLLWGKGPATGSGQSLPLLPESFHTMGKGTSSEVLSLMSPCCWNLSVLSESFPAEGKASSMGAGEAAGHYPAKNSSLDGEAGLGQVERHVGYVFTYQQIVFTLLAKAACLTGYTAIYTDAWRSQGDACTCSTCHQKKSGT
ncbi:hypothetical protein UY3_12164 [Chelonia mydas]|uniref:Uncharacterized protein n=1 Tax=Chelonia mydas TaxID=8469 RepID=M7BRH6_CHEMY|nr:hypothetical protein UY3_12164 [Chelonia mydas]